MIMALSTQCSTDASLNIYTLSWLLFWTLNKIKQSKNTFICIEKTQTHTHVAIIIIIIISYIHGNVLKYSKVFFYPTNTQQMYANLNEITAVRHPVFFHLHLRIMKFLSPSLLSYPVLSLCHMFM